MTVVTKNVGRLPGYPASPEYDSQTAYGRKQRCIQYGCEIESLVDNNTYTPFTWDGDETFTLDGAHWRLISGNPKVWAAGNPKPASTGTTGDYPYNGMGRVVLKKNMVGGVCTLTQDMFYKGEVGSRVPNTNTIFVIQYDFVLGENITIPANCVLKFDGGSISGGKAYSNNTKVDGATVENSTALFGIFYDLKGNPITRFGEKVSSIKFDVDFATLGVYPRITSGQNQSIVVTDENVFLFFNTPLCLVYDLNYNEIGRTSLPTGHYNGATIKGDYIYTIIGSTSSLENDTKVVRVLASTLKQNAINGVATTLEEITVTGISSPSFASIDYCQNNDEFLLRNGRTIYIYNGDFSEIKQTIECNTTIDSLVSDYDLTGGVTWQDTIYRNGIAYALLCQFTYASQSGFAILPIDVNNGNIGTLCKVDTPYSNIEIEGGFIRQSDNSVWVSFVATGIPGAEGIFGVGRLYANDNLEFDRSFVDVEHPAIAQSGVGNDVYIDNLFTGKSYGTPNAPYKTIGEALAMRHTVSNKLNIYLKPNNTANRFNASADNAKDYSVQNPYYCYRMVFTGVNVTIQRWGDTGVASIHTCIYGNEANIILKNIHIGIESGDDVGLASGSIFYLNRSKLYLDSGVDGTVAKNTVSRVFAGFYSSEIIFLSTDDYNFGVSYTVNGSIVADFDVDLFYLSTASSFKCNGNIMAESFNVLVFANNAGVSYVKGNHLNGYRAKRVTNTEGSGASPVGYLVFMGVDTTSLNNWIANIKANRVENFSIVLELDGDLTHSGTSFPAGKYFNKGTDIVNAIGTVIF